MVKAPSITFYLRGTKPDRQSINCMVTHAGEKHRFSTGLTIEKKNWNTPKGKPRNVVHPTIQLIEESISTIENDLLNIFLENQKKGVTLTPKELVEELSFRNSQNTEKPKTLSEVIELRIKEMEQKVKAGKQKPSTVKDFKAFQNFWNRFISETFSFEPRLNTFDQALVLQYIQFSIDNGDMPSTTNDKRLKWLKTAWKYAHDNKLTENGDYNLAKRQKYDVTRPVLSSSELQKLYKLYETGKSTTTIDLILLGCLTGLRFGDLSKNVNWKQALDSEHKNPRIRVKTEKTGKVVQLLISTKAQSILQKYDYNPPYPSNSQVFSRQAKADLMEMKVFKKVKTDYITGEKYTLAESFSPHCMRRTFVSLLIKNNMPLTQVRQYSGHSFVSTVELYAQSFTDDLDKDYHYFEKL